MLTIKLAFRNLFRNTRRTILTMVLIGFSLTALILTDGVMIGMTKVMTDSVTETLNGEAQVHRKGFLDSYNVDLVLKDSATLESIIASDPSVSAYGPRVMAGGMVSSTYNVTGGLILGVDAAKEIKVSKIREAVTRGEYLAGTDSEILIGESLAELLEVDLGDRIVVTLAEAETGELSQALFRVSGLFKFGIREFDEAMVFINLAKAREIAGLTTESHQIIVRFKNPEDAENPALSLYQQLNQEDVEAVSWLEANPEIEYILSMTGYSSLMIGAVLFLIAALGVINSMFMSIYERIYEIGVLKAVGTRSGEVVNLVLWEAGILATISCILGALLGAGLAYYYSVNGIPLGDIEVSGISFSDNIKTVFASKQFIEFPLIVIGLTVLSAIYPARFAARILPAVALQRSL